MPRARNRISLTCRGCGGTFEVPPSHIHHRYCSRPCYHASRRSPVSLVKVVQYKPGRQKKSRDTDRTCPTCSTVFTLPEWHKKTFCSLPCSNAARKNRPKPPSRQIAKTCPICSKEFSVPPSHGHIVCCSSKCGGIRKRTADPGSAREMTQIESAWLAGLFDGEGCVAIPSRYRQRNTPSYRIEIANTDMPLLEQVVKVTGVSTIRTHLRDNPRHKTAYHWEAGGADALSLLRQMRPWLIVKAERADAAFRGEIFPRQARWDLLYPNGQAD